MEHLHNLDGRCNLLLDLWCKQTLHSRLDLVNSIVNYGVDAYIYIVLFSHSLGSTRRTHFETYYDGV